MRSVFIALALAGCAAPDRFAGIDLRPGGAEPDLQHYARLASTGDRAALYTLGIGYEFGYGLPRDLHRARDLYRRAATRSGGTVFVYQPPIAKGGQGRVVPIDTGPVQEGLPEAKVRLAAVEAALAADPRRP